MPLASQVERGVFSFWEWLGLLYACRRFYITSGKINLQSTFELHPRQNALPGRATRECQRGKLYAIDSLSRGVGETFEMAQPLHSAGVDSSRLKAQSERYNHVTQSQRPELRMRQRRPSAHTPQRLASRLWATPDGRPSAAKTTSGSLKEE